MSWEAWGTPPDQEPGRCPLCDGTHHTKGCEFCDMDKERAKLRKVARAYISMIETVEQRCMAADGPVTPTHQEITDAELRAVYVLALDALGNPPR